MEIGTIRHKALRRFAETGKPAGLMEADRLRRMLAFIASAGSVDELAADIHTDRRTDRRRSRSGGLSLMAIKLHDSFAIHPGPWLLEEIVKPYNMNVSSTADHLKVTRPALSRLLNGRAALTPEMAIRFEKAFGISAATMLRMQSAYDLAQAKSGSETISIARVREPA